MANNEDIGRFFCKQFDGTGYNVWRHRILGRLRTLNIDYLTTAPLAVITPATTAAETTARELIRNHLDDQIVLFYCEDEESVYQIIQRLDNDYLEKGPVKGIYLRDQLFNLKFSRPLKSMFQKFRNLVNEISIHSTAMSIEDQLHFLYQKMPAEYRPTIEFLRRDPHPSLQRAMQTLERTEKDLSNIESSKLLFSRGYNSFDRRNSGQNHYTGDNNSRGRFNVIRYRRGRGCRGHGARGRGSRGNNRDQGYYERDHNYSNYKSDNNQNTRVKCYKCQEFGHKANQCRAPNQAHSNI